MLGLLIHRKEQQWRFRCMREVGNVFYGPHGSRAVDIYANYQLNYILCAREQELLA
tara:strand:- start:155 stop:322 length:168 start_codon:yes stop_codon:yes gene_type:complete